MGRTACTEPQCLYSTAIPLLPSVPVQYSYTSTPPMGRTACTEPQYLYSTAISLLPLWTVRPVQSLSACTRVIFNFTYRGLANIRRQLREICFFGRPAAIDFYTAVVSFFRESIFF